MYYSHIKDIWLHAGAKISSHQIRVWHTILPIQNRE